jgi:putative nucleotidyltransferase with HDIG domain
VATAEADVKRAARPDTPSDRREHKSSGRRLLDAFEAFERFPAFASARSEVAAAQSAYRLGTDLIAAIESDLALTVAVLRRANSIAGGRPTIASVPTAVAHIGPEGLHDVVESTPAFELFGTAGAWGAAPQVHRIHALATQRAAARIASEVAYHRGDELYVAALLHDIGKLVLTYADARYANIDMVTDLSPERRIELERRELGVDHALVGGVLARRWGLPLELARAIERHHEPTETGLGGMVRLADMIARFEAGNPVGTKSMQRTAASVGLAPDRLETLLFVPPTGERRSTLPNPLTPAEQRIVAELAKGHVYKQIAQTLGVSASTVRSHLYNTYKKLGVSDRAQATMLARENNWI